VRASAVDPPAGWIGPMDRSRRDGMKSLLIRLAALALPVLTLLAAAAPRIRW
jgi:hypothetical protein